MVTIDQKDFNKDMGRYLESIRKKKSVPIASRVKFLRGLMEEEVPELQENQVHVEYEEPSLFRKIIRWRRRYKLRELEEELTEEEKENLEELEGEIEALEQEESELEAMEEEVEDRKGNLLTRLMQKINIFKAQHEDEYVEGFDEEEAMQITQMDEDIKDVLKIAHTWVDKLPAKHKKEFKDSEDFEKYKTILMKYGLIKEKEKK
ncbi:MAG: hypothetical protein ISS25_02295 [Nanoarchaeota archaeon]|nr:hypothetical protein [DPANN group archaeon]MBL7116635.1 hypothetical protein [Nanoarchaeota archaeon]